MARVGQGGRAALLEAAVTVIARDGLRGFTYRAVAAEAGVAHSLVRHHFGTRDALVAEALTFVVERSLAESSMTPGVDSPDAFAAGLVGSVIEHADLHAFQYELLLEVRRRPELRTLADRYYDAYRSAIASQIRRIGIEDDGLADVIWLALDGLVFRLLILGDDRAAAQTIADIRRLLRSRIT